MKERFEIQLAEMYYGTPIVEVRCSEPTLLTAETDAELARRVLELPYSSLAVVVDYRKLSHASTYGPEEETELHRSELFVELSRRVVTWIRYQAVSMTSLVHSMRVHMMLRHAMSFSFAPDYEAAVRAARRAIDRMQVPAT